MWLLRGCREDGQVGAEWAEFGRARNAQWQTLAIVADPHSQLIFIGLGIVGRDRQTECRYCLISELNYLFLQRLDKQSLGLILDQHSERVSLFRGEIKSAQHIKEGHIIVCADGYLDARTSIARRDSLVLVHR